MKRLTSALASAAILTLVSPLAFAANDDTPLPIQPIQLGDSAKACDALVAEANSMQTILGGAPEGGVFGSQQAINTASGLAVEGALRSGLGGQAAGAIGFLGRAAGAAAKRREEAEAARKEAALKRWYYIVGLYQGRSCDKPQPEPVPAPEPVQEAQADPVPVPEAPGESVPVEAAQPAEPQ